MGSRIGRREFLKAAGTAAGAVAAGGYLSKISFGQEAAEAFATTGVLRPTFAAPAIVKTGAEIPFIAASDLDTKIESLWLQPRGGSGKVALSMSQSALKPESQLLPGMYDLFANVTSAGKSRVEKQPNAVKVTDAFKKDFKFGVISDVHFGDTRLQSKISGFSVPDTIKKEIGQLNDKGVEFCLCCGDLCFLPPKSKKEIMDYGECIGANANFPTFTVPGNHDGYTSGAAGRIQFDTFTHWRKFFGPLNFSASYGDISLIGINTFDKTQDERNVYGGLGDKADMGAVEKPQLEWIENQLKAARSNNPSGQIIMLGHHNPTNTEPDVNGQIVTYPFSETGRTELLSLWEKYSVDYFFCGHVHSIHRETYGKTEVVTAPTAGSLPETGSIVGYFIVNVAGGKISSVETVEILKP